MSSSVHGFKLKRKRYDITATATATTTTGTCMGTHACTHACKHTSFSLTTPHFHNTVELETTEMTETEIAATRATTTVITMITGGKKKKKEDNNNNNNNNKKGLHELRSISELQLYSTSTNNSKRKLHTIITIIIINRNSKYNCLANTRKKKTTTTTTTTTTKKTKNGYMNFVQSVSYSFTPPAPTTANESYIQ